MNECTRSLRVHIGPSLKWEKQFKIMIEKMMELVVKIKKIDIYPSIAYIFFNMYLCRKVYFGYSIVDMNDKQEKELIRIYKPMILKKIGFGEKFLRSCLYLRRTALGIRLIKPRTIMAILVLKLYIRYK